MQRVGPYRHRRMPARRPFSIIGPGLRSAGAATLIAIGAALAIWIAFFLLANASLRADHRALGQAIGQAFADDTLDPEASWLIGDTDRGAHQYNDCLILYQALDDRAPADLRAISPLSPPPGDKHACLALKRLAAGQTRMPARFYHQYLHAHTVLARMLVPSMGVAGLRGLYKLSLTLLLLAGTGLAISGMMAGRAMQANTIWLVTFFVFARWFGLESFGQSIGHAPADLVVLGYLLFLMRGIGDTPHRPGTAITGAAIFGALTMQFEFLTGGIPLGLGIVIGMVPLTLAGDARIIPDTVRCTAAFLGAALATALIKLFAVTIVFGAAPRAGPPVLAPEMAGAMFSQVATISAAALLVAAVHGLLKHTQFGRHLRASAQDPEMAAAIGVPVTWMVMATFALATALAGVAGLLLSHVYLVQPEDGTTYMLKAYIAVTLGGWGRVGGAVVQLAKLRGARVIAMASEAKHGDVAALGADRLLPRDPGDLEAALANKKITIIADVVGGAIWPALINVLTLGGRYTYSGAIAGPMVNFDLRTFYLHDLTFTGSTVID